MVLKRVQGSGQNLNKEPLEENTDKGTKYVSKYYLHIQSQGTRKECILRDGITLVITEQAR